MKRKPTTEEIKRAYEINEKIKKVLNIVITIGSVIAMCVCAILLLTDNMTAALAGVLIPLFMAIFMLMNAFAMKDDNRKGVMIAYIIGLSISLIVLFFDIIYFNVIK